MPGPPPKRPATRTRQPRGAALLPLRAVQGGRRASPEPPEALSDGLKELWRVFWASQLADLVIEADYGAFLRLFQLYKQRESYFQVGSDDPVVTGSTGQLVLSPLIREVDALDVKILALEDRFGLSPRARLQLQVTLGDAADGLTKLNQALRAAQQPDEEPEEPDIRLAVGGDAAALGNAPAAHRRTAAADVRSSGRAVHRAGPRPRRG